MDVLVFDTGPLSHFARANILGVLKIVVGWRRAVVPEAVVMELREGLHVDSRLQTVLDADWLEQRAILTPAETEAYAMFSRRLVLRDRNVGDAAVLALAQTMPARAVIDDWDACDIARKEGVALSRTLNLLCEAIHSKHLTPDFVSDIADELIATEYRLPFGPGEFKAWAARENIFPYGRAAEVGRRSVSGGRGSGR